MKRTLIVAGLLMASTGAFAREYPNNPDRLPSIGLNYSGQGLTGDTTITDTGASAKQDLKTSSGILALDTRIPLSDSFTLNAAIGLVGSKVTSSETNLLAGSEDSQGGLAFNIGARFYIR